VLEVEKGFLKNPPVWEEARHADHPQNWYSGRVSPVETARLETVACPA